MNESPAGTASWSQLLRRPHLGTVVALAGAVAVFATNNYVTSSLLPSVLADIGGERYFAWTATAFLVASVFAALLISRILSRFGIRNAILLGLTVFAAGSALCTVSPSIWFLLLGRLVQGLGGGLMSGLALATMRMVLPERLWGRMLVVISLMWAIGNVGGPALGGVFAQLGEWRLGFATMLVAAVALAVVAVRSLPGTRGTEAPEPLPTGSLLIVTAGVAAVSVASIVPKGVPTALMIALGAALVVAFLGRERRADNRILPASTYARGATLRWYYLGVAGLTVGLTAETFVPLFGQRLAGLSPLGAGFLGSAISMGWSVAQIVTNDVSGERAMRRLRVIAPGVVALGLGLTAVAQRDHAGGGVIAVWVVTLFVAGAGIGMGFARFAFPVMTSSDDPVEATKAAAGLNVVQVISTAFGSAIGGVLVNLGAPSDLHSARLLYGGLAVLALLGVAAGARTVRVGRPQSEAAAQPDQREMSTASTGPGGGAET